MGKVQYGYRKIKLESVMWLFMELPRSYMLCKLAFQV